MTDLLAHAIEHLAPAERDMINRDLITLSNIRNLSHSRFLKHAPGTDVVVGLHRRAEDSRRDLAHDIDVGWCGMVGLS